jgi:hypothetical protein
VQFDLTDAQGELAARCILPYHFEVGSRGYLAPSRAPDVGETDHVDILANQSASTSTSGEEHARGEESNRNPSNDISIRDIPSHPVQSHAAPEPQPSAVEIPCDSSGTVLSAVFHDRCSDPQATYVEELAPERGPLTGGLRVVILGDNFPTFPLFARFGNVVVRTVRLHYDTGSSRH